jgi:serine/threonine protein kinase
MGCCFSTTDAGAARRHAALLGPPDGRGFGTGSGGGNGGFDFRGSNADPSALDEDLARLYELKHPLGSGSAGETWLCRCRATGELVAVKLMPRPLPGGMTTSIFREAKIGAQLGRGHLNVVKPRDLVLTRRHLGLVMEYVAGGNMADYILKALLLKHGSFDPLPGEAPRGLVLDEDEARYYFLQVVRAVDFCHRNAVVHRDLKMDNTLLDSSDPPRVKLCDFGFANWWPALGGVGGGAGGAAPFQSHARPASSQQQQGLPPRAPQQQGIDHASSLTRFQGDAGGAGGGNNTGGGSNNQQQREASSTAASAAAAALRFPSNVATITGTPDYMSPQILSSKVHGRARGTYDAPKADVWACGVLLCVMLLGRFPFDGANAVDGGGGGAGGGGSGRDSGSGSSFDDGGGGGGAGNRYGGYPYRGGDQDHYHGAADEAAQRQEQDASMSVYLQQQAVLGQRAVKGSAGEGGGGGLGGSFSRSASGRRRSGSCGGSSGGRAPSLAESVAGSEGQQVGADGGAPASSALPSSPGASSPLPRPKRWFDHPALSGSAAFLTEGARDLLARIFEPDEDARISVKGILEHPWSTAPMPEPFCSALEQMMREQERIDGEVAAGRHASRDRDAALKQMVYAASQPFDPNVVSVGAAAVGASVRLGEDKQHDEEEAADVGGGGGGAGGGADEGAAGGGGGAAADAGVGDAVRRVSLSAPPNPAEWAERPRADPAEVARFFAMHSPDGLVSAEPTAHGGGDALGALRGAGGAASGVGASAPPQG